VLAAILGPGRQSRRIFEEFKRFTPAPITVQTSRKLIDRIGSVFLGLEFSNLSLDGMFPSEVWHYEQEQEGLTKFFPGIFHLCKISSCGGLW
jgi:hypothetical protein